MTLYRVSAQSLEVLSVSAANVRVTAQSLEVLTDTYQIRLPKAYALAVLGPNPAAVALQKAYALAVLSDPAALPATGEYNISQALQVPAQSYSLSANELDMSRLQVREAGTITTITYYAGSTAMTGMPVIYASSGSATGMGLLLWSGSTTTVPASGYQTVTVNLAIGSAQEIWVGFHAQSAGVTQAYTRLDKDAAAASVNPGLYKAATYGTPPAGPVTGATSYAKAMALQVFFLPTVSTDRTWAGAEPPISTTSQYTAMVDELNLRQITFTSAVWVNKLRIWSTTWRLDESVKPVIYAHTGGVPGARLALGSAVVGVYPGAMDLPFASEVALSAGTYWIGIVGNAQTILEVQTGLIAPTSYKAVAGQYATVPDPAPGSMATATVASLGVAVSYSLSSAVTTRRRPVVAFAG
jgi:hypothetical protein